MTRQAARPELDSDARIAERQAAHRPSCGANATPNMPHDTSNRREVRPAATNPDGFRHRRAPGPAPGCAGEGLRRAVQRASSRARRRRTLRPPGRVRRRGGRVSRGTPGPRRQAGIRGHLAAGRRRLSAALHGATGRWPAVGRGLRAPRGAGGAGPATLLSGRVAALRGDRSARRGGEGDRQPDRRPRRRLPRGPVVRLHRGPGGGAADRCRRGDIPPGARAGLLSYRP
jgi:hypothetical protein